MTKTEFLSALRDKLSGLPAEDIRKSMDYYDEIIDDRIDDGLSEAEAVDAIGPVDAAVSEILADISIPKLVKSKMSVRRASRTWEILLLALGSPIWLSLLIAAAAVLLSVYITLWSIAAVLYAVTLSFVAAALAGLLAFGFLIFRGSPIQALIFMGLGLVCFGLALLLFRFSNLSAAGLARASKKLLIGIKRRMLRKETLR